jgi:hypothetical protein
VNPGDLIDTGWLRRLTLSAAVLLLLGVAAWFLWPAGTPLAWIAGALALAALVPLGMQLLQLRRSTRRRYASCSPPTPSAWRTSATSAPSSSCSMRWPASPTAI